MGNASKKVAETNGSADETRTSVGERLLGRLISLGSSLRYRRVLVLVIGATLEVLLLWLVSMMAPQHLPRGLAGAVGALVGVLAAVVAGPWVGLAVSLVGGAALFTVVVPLEGGGVLPTNVLPVILWAAAAAAAGLTADRLRAEVARREQELQDTLTSLSHMLDLTPQLRGDSIEDVARAICRVARLTFKSDVVLLGEFDGQKLKVLASLPTGGYKEGDVFFRHEMPRIWEDVESLRPSFVPLAGAFDMSAHAADVRRAAGANTVLRIPVRSVGKTRNLLTLAWNEDRTAPDAVFLALAERFADQAGMALDQAEVEQLHHRLEESLLPRLPVSQPGFNIAVRYLSGESRLEIGGDFLDAVRLKDGALALIIGDVSGHGPEAAGLGASLRMAWRALAMAGVQMERTAAILQRILLIEEPSPDFFASALMAEIRPGQIRLLTAGHPAPILLAEEPLELELPPAAPLGMNSAADWRSWDYELLPGSTVLFYTDGLIEGRVSSGAPARFGVNGLLDWLSHEARGLSPAGLLDRLLARVVEANGGPLPDDVAAIVVSPASIDIKGN